MSATATIVVRGKGNAAALATPEDLNSEVFERRFISFRVEALTAAIDSQENASTELVIDGVRFRVPASDDRRDVWVQWADGEMSLYEFLDQLGLKLHEPDMNEAP